MRIDAGYFVDFTRGKTHTLEVYSTSMHKCNHCLNLESPFMLTATEERFILRLHFISTGARHISRAFFMIEPKILLSFPAIQKRFREPVCMDTQQKYKHQENMHAKNIKMCCFFQPIASFFTFSVCFVRCQRHV